MKRPSWIIALFFSDESNLIFEEIKHEKEFSKEQKNQLKMLPFQFLGPIFLTAASAREGAWKIDFIEYSLSLKQQEIKEADILQTFFALNSTMESAPGMNTNLFALIGSPYTEDPIEIYKKITDYIHPSILQGTKMNQLLLGKKFNREKFIKEELIRGLHLIEYYLGSSRKLYWKEKKNYYCVVVTERKIGQGIKHSTLYTIEPEDSLRRRILELIPSFYVLSVLPDYYENLLKDTLALFEKKGIFINIRQINLSLKEKEVLYFEDFIIEKGIKRSIGCFLIPLIDDASSRELRNKRFYHKQIRNILDNDLSLTEYLQDFNINFSPRGWNINTEDDLNHISLLLDNTS